MMAQLHGQRDGEDVGDHADQTGEGPVGPGQPPPCQRAPLYAYVNADEIAAARWPDDADAHAYEAAAVAAKTRAHLIAGGRSFITETVFSHPSKLDLIHAAQKGGCHVVAHAMLVPEELAVKRVAYRVQAGGHDVPEHKVRKRYRRLWQLVAQAVSIADRAVVYDNSRPTGPLKVAELVSGLSIGAVAWPAWAPKSMRSGWDESPMT